MESSPSLRIAGDVLRSASTSMHHSLADIGTVMNSNIHRATRPNHSDGDRLTKDERDALQHRIATDLHDELGSDLTQISLYSELIRRESTGHVATWAGELGARARALTGKMQDIVWAINPDDDGWRGLESRIRDYTSQLVAPKNIRFEIWGTVHDAPDHMPLELRRNVLLIYKEIVHNAVRHSGCSRIEVRYRLTSETFWMRVTDNGKGFNPDAVQQNNGLRNVRCRSGAICAMLSLDTAPGGPTSYALSVPFLIEPPERVGAASPASLYPSETLREELSGQRPPRYA